MLFAVLACCSLMSMAQSKTGALNLTTPADYQIISMSENGQWACGLYSSDYATFYGFCWNLTSGKIDLFEGDTEAYAVSNDGTVVGSYTSNKLTGSATTIAATWKDGQWTDLEYPSKTVGAWATGISPDGHYVSGTDNNYVSYIWKDGKLQHTAKVRGIVPEANGTFVSSTISPDGKKIGGWAYYSDDNRNPGYWDSEDETFHELNPGNPGSPWQTVRKFSPDSKRVLFWGSYNIDTKNPDKGYGIKAIYDLEKKDTTYIYPIWDDPFNFDLYDMGGNGSVVGYIQDNEGMEYGIIYKNGVTSYIDDYLKQHGADFSALKIAPANDSHIMIFRAMCISADEKTYGLVYYDENYDMMSLVVKLDQDLSNMPPVRVEATRVPGLLTASLTWNEPLGDKSTLKGYNIYRNGTKINSALVTTTNYIDQNLKVGTYSYAVTAIYAEGESAKSEESKVSISVKTPQAPRELMARQKGYKSVYALWDEPSTNYIQCNYFGQGNNATDGFGGGDISFESGTLFSDELITLYEGYRLVGISFIPRSKQGSWIVNIYRHLDGSLKLLKSIPVTQELNYGVANTVRLPQPLTLQAGQDLLIGIQANVVSESYDVQAVYENCLKVGYTDLIRQVGEEDFYSINEMSQGATYDMAWATEALLAAPNESTELDKIDHYTIYLDGSKKAEVKTIAYEDSSLAEGSHTIGVQTVYADGRTSETLSTTVSLTANTSMLAVTPKVVINDNMMTASWTGAMDNDATVMGYCRDTKASSSPNATESVSEIIARVDFTPTELRSYEGYLIQSLSFLPLSNSSFELQVYEDGEALIAAPVDEFTIGSWNTISLDEPIKIQKNKTYSYCVVCYDCPANQAPLAIDNVGSVNSKSCMIQAGGESEWYTISEESGLDGNWMMRMNIASANGTTVAADGYDVYLDGMKRVMKQNVNEYTCQLIRNSLPHTLRVDAYYNGELEPIMGNAITFDLNSANAITGIQKDGKYEGHLYNVAGQKVNNTYKGLIIKNGKTLLK